MPEPDVIEPTAAAPARDPEIEQLRDQLDAAYRRLEGRRLRLAAARAERARALAVVRRELGDDLGLGTAPLREDREYVLRLHATLSDATLELAQARVLEQQSRDEILLALRHFPRAALFMAKP